ncbi:MAG TPA: YaaR family protein [Acetivibrio sp.]|nr:YaaR family protein [Clostridium sp.]HOQ36508.1 YaaR family protein [Acetivibrio sp.]HPT90815.1 YaaR family protein [Acetivibrio sp.]HQA56655.1 YaaR family protein [Acetivibrio sp.]
MKIKESINSPTGLPEVVGNNGRRVADSSAPSFRSQLQQLKDLTHEEKIRFLVSQIEEQGKKLSERIDVKELKVYKRLISEFLDEALNNSQLFSKDSRLDRRGRYKVYATVKKVNQHLEELTKQVLSAEEDNLRILQRIEDIRGLILDLVL